MSCPCFSFTTTAPVSYEVPYLVFVVGINSSSFGLDGYYIYCSTFCRQLDIKWSWHHKGTENMSSNCVSVTCSFYDAFLCRSWTPSLGSCCFPYGWYITLQLRIIRSLLHPSRYITWICKHSPGKACNLYLVSKPSRIFLCLSCKNGMVKRKQNSLLSFPLCLDQIFGCNFVTISNPGQGFGIKTLQIYLMLINAKHFQRNIPCLNAS